MGYPIAPDKMLYNRKVFLLHKNNYVVGIQSNEFVEAIQVNTNRICFHAKIISHLRLHQKSHLQEWQLSFCQLQSICTKYWLSLSYTMVHAHVRCDNAWAWASVLSHVHAQNHGITDLSHFHACRPTTSPKIFHAECWEVWLLCDNYLED